MRYAHALLSVGLTEKDYLEWKEIFEWVTYRGSIKGTSDADILEAVKSMLRSISQGIVFIEDLEPLEVIMPQLMPFHARERLVKGTRFTCEDLKFHIKDYIDVVNLFE